jgi:hypothetical protein
MASRPITRASEGKSLPRQLTRPRLISLPECAHRKVKTMAPPCHLEFRMGEDPLPKGPRRASPCRVVVRDQDLCFRTSARPRC